MTQNESEHQPDRIGDRLIEADPTMTTTEPRKGIDPMFERLLEDERRFEERVHKIAIGSWAVALASLVLLVSVVAFFGGVRLSSRAEMDDVAVLLLGPIGSVALLSAIVTSLMWLLRSRTPTLRAIAYRLEALERRLTTEHR